MKWKAKPKAKQDEEEFVGTLRAKMSNEARNFLKPLVPIRKVERDGLIFNYYPDGHVEVISYFDLMHGMVKEMQEFKKGKKRGF